MTEACSACAFETTSTRRNEPRLLSADVAHPALERLPQPCRGRGLDARLSRGKEPRLYSGRAPLPKDLGIQDNFTSEVVGGTARHSGKNQYCPARFGTVDRYAQVSARVIST